MRKIETKKQMTNSPSIFTAAELESLKDPAWRLNNLYMVIDEHGKAVPFKMRDAQSDMLTNMTYRNIILKARQLGFSTFVQIFILDSILWIGNLRAVVIAHTKEDMQSIFRDKIKFGYDNLPEEIKALNPAVKKDSGELLLSNNSGVRVTTSARSGTAQIIHVSELGKLGAKYPAKAREIIRGSIPAVHEGGFVFIESTAEGRDGVFYDLCQHALQRTSMARELSPMEFKLHFYPWYENPTNVTDPKNIVIPDRLTTYFKSIQGKLKIKLSKEQMAWYTVTESILGDDMKAEHPSSPEEAFEVSIEGAYYKQQMDKMYQDNRVGEFPYDPEYPVDTAWDIGHGDATAIWFRQKKGNWNYIIDYMEASGEDLPYFAGKLKEKGYKYGTHISPHDMKHVYWGTGHTAKEQALLTHGISFVDAPNISVQDGVQAVRRMLNKTKINEAKCERLLQVLSSYRKDWNSSMGCWRNTPRHDIFSNGADAGRYLAIYEPGVEESVKQPAKQSVLTGCGV